MCIRDRAVNEAICETTGIRAKIKWPNDIIVNGKKICGILTEMSLQMDEINYIVVGLGINVNIDHFPEDLSDKATSLQIEGGRKIKRAPLAAKVLECFEKYYDMFLKTEDLSMLQDEYNKLLVHTDQKIKVVRGSKEEIFLSRGINHRGELLVEDEDGKVSEVSSGEVSVRGILGYV